LFLIQSRNIINAKNMTALCLAIVLDRSELVLDILTAGADVNYSNEEGWVISP
jgi:50S ribosomal subunit-associated GTPase HflX